MGRRRSPATRFGSARTRLAALVALSALAAGCGVLYWIGLKFVYRKADLPDALIARDLAYVNGPDAHRTKHRLNLFRAEGRGWPTVVFAHGGGWVEGDRDLRVGGADVYGNIGRYLAGHGVGTAVISYRLLPSVQWRAQITDVARAVAWVHGNVASYGGDPRAIFLMGHSAGAQLAARVALDSEPLRSAGVDRGIVCGVIAVSGAGYDLSAEPDRDRRGRPAYFAGLFGGDGEPDWRRAAAPITFVSSSAPPFLFMYAGGEDPGVQRQSRLLDEALRAARATSSVVVVPGLSHERIVLSLSQQGRSAGHAALAFMHQTRCPR